MPHCSLRNVCTQGLASQGWEIISTGGTASSIQQMGVACKKVEDVTGFPEMLDGKG
jgi:phosphoribosylaminoimidazolecarboxamide formyltransferase/IMP cyclohydrolase